MADDRPLDDPTSMIAALQQQVDDMNTTLQSRTARMPTGFIQPWIGTIAPTNSVLMQGQALSRTTYAVLWQWVQDQSIVGTNLPFGVGDGSTTFTVPDLRDRVVVGASATQGIGTLFGANSLILSSAQLPGHTHAAGTLVTDTDSHKHDHTTFHTHGFNTNNGGSHGGHNFSGTIPTGSGLPYGQDAAGDHTHGGQTAGDGSYTHTTYGHSHNMTGSTASTGSGSSVDMLQSSIAINWILWT